MRTERTLSVSNPTLSINLTFDVVAMVVFNPTASPVFIRTGGPDFPDQGNANIIVPAAQAETIPIGGPGARDFALVVGSPSLITGTGSSVSGLFSTVVVTFLSAGEVIPTFGSYSFLSLSLSNLTTGFLAVAGTTTSAWFDLSPWGGAMLYFVPTTGSGQGVITVETTDSIVNPVTTRQLDTYSFWPGTPVVLTVPRVTRYIRFIFNATGIAGEPAIAGSYNVRATLAEVFEKTYSQAASSIVKAINVSALSSQDVYFVTPNIPALSISFVQSSGLTFQYVFYVNSTLNPATWRRLTQREQSGAGLGATLFRSFGALDQFLRVQVVETSNVILQGTLTAEVIPESEPNAMLSEILNALGTTYDPVNVGQNIYQVLRGIATSDASIDTKLTTVNTNLSTIHTDLVTINTSLTTANSTLNAINTNTTTVNFNLGTVNANLASIDGHVVAVNTTLGVISGQLTTINTNITTVNTNLATVNAHLTNIETYTQSLYQRGITSSVVAADLTACAAGVWTRGGAIFNPGSYILELDLFVQFNAFVAAQANITVDIGTNASQVTFLALGMTANTDLIGAKLTPFLARFRFDGTRTGGILIPANNLYVWYNMSVAGTATSTWILG